MAEDWIAIHEKLSDEREKNPDFIRNLESQPNKNETAGIPFDWVDFHKNMESKKLLEKAGKNIPINNPDGFKLDPDNPPKGATYSDTTIGNDILHGFFNLPLSAFGQVSDSFQGLYTLITQLPMSSRALYSIASGAIKKGAIETMKFEGKLLGYNEVPLYLKKYETDEDIGNFLKFFDDEIMKQYGTTENLRNTIRNDPARLLFDTASFVFPFLKAVRAPKALINLVSKMEPINLATQTIRIPIASFMRLPVINEIPEKLMKRALKSAEVISFDKQDKLVTTALKSGFLVNKRNFDNAEDIITSINETLRTHIKDHNFKKPLYIDDIFNGQTWKDARSELLKNASREDIVKSFNEAEQSFKKVFKDYQDDAFIREGKIPKDYLTPVELQDRKVQLNKDLDFIFNQLKAGIDGAPLNKQTQNALRIIFKEHLEAVIPELKISQFDKPTANLIRKMYPKLKSLPLKDINQIEGDLISLNRAIEQTVMKQTVGSLFPFQLISKQATGAAFAYAASNLSSIGDPVVMASVGSIMGVTLGLLDSSANVKSKLSQYLNRLQSYGIEVNQSATMIRLFGGEAKRMIDTVPKREYPDTLDAITNFMKKTKEAITKNPDLQKQMLNQQLEP